MRSKGIRILDEENGVISVKLEEILDVIVCGDLYNWSILFFNGRGKLGKSIKEFQGEINSSKVGMLMSWRELNSIAKEIYDISDILIIGSKTKEVICRNENDYEMYESCDFVIEMIDGYSWEVFSFDLNFIERLSRKFKKIERLNPDFQNEWLKNK